MPGFVNAAITWVRSNAVIVSLWLLGLAHRLAFWLDDLLFPSLHKASIRQPLFIFGLPRSGTTLLHRLVASDGGNFTTPSLWEVLFAPALCEKRFFQGLYRLDKALGGMGFRCLNWLEGLGRHRQSSVHATSLQTPEEDFLALLPFGGCFLMVLAWPHSESVWQLGHFRDQLPEIERKRLLKLYRGLVARHLQFRGVDKVYLTKNPSFTGWASDLAGEFPDARMIGLRREPTKVVASQLSSLEGGFAFFGFKIDQQISSRFVKMLARYWHLLEGYQEELGGNRFRLVEYRSLIDDPFACVSRTLAQLGYAMSPTYQSTLNAACQQASSYRSQHNYTLEEYQLDSQQVLAEFKTIGQAVPPQSVQPPQSTSITSSPPEIPLP